MTKLRSRNKLHREIYSLRTQTYFRLSQPEIGLHSQARKYTDESANVESFLRSNSGPTTLCINCSYNIRLFGPDESTAEEELTSRKH